MSKEPVVPWRATLVLVGVGTAVIILVAWITQLWVLSAVPVGFWFGFFLQKGDLCGASACSEVILFKDGRKLFGIWVAIVVSMVAFSLGDLTGLVELNPKPMLWWNYILGGAVFGVGTVLAGGCVSGCLYKGATGNLNSLVALLAMPLGIALIEHGPLREWMQGLKAIRTDAPGGGPLTLPAVTGVPFSVWALLFGGGTVAWFLLRGEHRHEPSLERVREPLLPRLMTRPWRPWQAGLAIGLLALFGYLSSAATGRNYPLGVTHGVYQAELLITDAPVHHLFGPATTSTPSSVPTPSSQKTVNWWLVLVVGSLAAGALIAGRLSGQARLRPKPPEQTLVAIPGGFLVGAGAALATGCVVGNVLSGWALMSLGMVLFGIVALLANWVTTYFYLLRA